MNTRKYWETKMKLPIPLSYMSAYFLILVNNLAYFEQNKFILLPNLMSNGMQRVFSRLYLTICHDPRLYWQTLNMASSPPRREFELSNVFLSSYTMSLSPHLFTSLWLTSTSSLAAHLQYPSSNIYPPHSMSKL